MSLKQTASLLSATLKGEDRRYSGVSTDTRKIQANELYIALEGPNFDGHQFVESARASGAAAAVVHKPVVSDLAQLLVADSHMALGQLAKHWREHLDLPVIGVTGSNGKTTVKEILYAIFSGKGKTQATRGNLNNDIGLPLSLLGLEADTAYAIIEMGANHPGEIAYLTAIAQPDVAILNNAAAAHLEGFGTLRGVAEAKAEIFSGLRKDGIAIINADDTYFSYWQDQNKGRNCLTFGMEHQADVTGHWQAGATGKQLHVQTPAGEFSCPFALLGKHNVMNALAAIAAAVACDIDASTIQQGLATVQPVAGRLQSKAGINGSLVIDDTYNANPNSLKAALAVLSEEPAQRILVLGDMGELGKDAEQLHRQAGTDARNAGVHKLFAIGDLSRHAVKDFGNAATHFSDYDALVAAVRPLLAPDVTVLVKGSRSMRMERIVTALVTQTDKSGE